MEMYEERTRVEEEFVKKLFRMFITKPDKLKKRKRVGS